MLVSVMGIGYTGLTTAIGLCEFGHKVHCYDDNKELIKNLLSQQYTSQIDPWIATSLSKFIENKQISFHSNLDETLLDTEAIIIAIPVKGIDNDIDLHPLSTMLGNIAPLLTRQKYVPIFIEKAVPLGVCENLAANLNTLRPDLLGNKHYDIIFHPNFLREGSGIHDFLHPDRMIFGFDSNSENAINIIKQLYKPLLDRNIAFIFTNFETAELIKSATMSIVTIKMAFANEIQQLCKNTTVDLDVLWKGIGSDRRVSCESLITNSGVGGSSLPRTARLLINSAKQFGVNLSILSMALESNSRRIVSISDKVMQIKTDHPQIFKISILGLTFKPLTDDYRESSSLITISTLIRNNFDIYIYDPFYSTDNYPLKYLPNDIKNSNKFHLCRSAYEAVSQSDALIVMTNWPEFAGLDMKKIFELMNKIINNKPVLFDCINIFSKHKKYFNYIAA